MRPHDQNVVHGVETDVLAILNPVIPSSLRLAIGSRRLGEQVSIKNQQARNLVPSRPCSRVDPLGWLSALGGAERLVEDTPRVGRAWPARPPP